MAKTKEVVILNKRPEVIKLGQLRRERGRIDQRLSNIEKRPMPDMTTYKRLLKRYNRLSIQIQEHKLRYGLKSGTKLYKIKKLKM